MYDKNKWKKVNKPTLKTDSMTFPSLLKKELLQNLLLNKLRNLNIKLVLSQPIYFSKKYTV